MRYYIASIISAMTIVAVVAFMWIRWGISTADYITGVAITLTVLIPVIVWWAIKKERDEKQKQRDSRDFGVAGLPRE